VIVIAAAHAVDAESAHGFPADMPLHRAARGTWDTASGLPHNRVTSLARTPDGYLWVGTAEGLARFDGDRFTVLKTGSDRPHDFVSTLHVTAEGTLLVGTNGGGVWALENGVLEPRGWDSELPSDHVLDFFEARDGALWIGTTAGPVRLEGESLERYGDRLEMAGHPATAFAEDLYGALWSGPTDARVRWLDANATRFTAADGLPDGRVLDLESGPDGSLWIGTSAGLARRSPDGSLQSWDRSDGLAGVPVNALFFDGRGTLYVGTGEGLQRWTTERFEPSPDELLESSSAVHDLYEDEEGTLWIGGRLGLESLSNTVVMMHRRRDGLPHDFVYSIAVSPDGTVWAGTAGVGVARLIGGRWTVEGPERGLPDAPVRAIHVARSGRVWASLGSHGVYVRGEAGWTSTGVPGTVRAFFEDDEGRLWLGTERGALTVLSDHGPELVANAGERTLIWAIGQDGAGRLLVGTKRDGLLRLEDGELVPLLGPGAAVMTIQRDRTDPSVTWIGTYVSGLYRLEGEDIFRFGPGLGVPDEAILNLLQDDAGAIWLGTNHGVFRLEKEALDTAREYRQPARAAWFGHESGMVSQECNGGNQPSAARTPDGRLWFPTAQGIGVIDPSRLPGPPPTPRTVLEEIVADGVSLEPQDGLVRLGPTRRLELRYTATALRAADRVRFRHRLVGFDEDWVDAGTRRQATYTSLPPATYTFEVAASVESGTWTTTPSRVRIRQPAKPLQRADVRFGIVFALLLCAFGLHQLRLAALRRRQEDLERLVKERTQALLDANVALRRLAAMDDLTGIANHRTFRVRLEGELRRARRTRTPIALLMVDIDHFKEFNDALGHEAGNNCLMQVARVLDEELHREGDFAARYGGDEFAVLLTGTHAEGAKAVSERLRSAVQALDIQAPGTGRLTVSIGVAGFEEVVASSRASMLIEAADAALYTAKERGRNRVESTR
jgi:diguanylate cyclase (GGDEF)-like protein